MEHSGNLVAAATEPSRGGRLATFYLDRLLFGVEIGDVQEVLPPHAITRVPLAARAVSGLINLRGRIVTAIDLREQLKLKTRASDATPMNVVVRTGDEILSLLVDEVGDIVEVDTNALERCPANVEGGVKDLISGVYQFGDQLILALDIQSMVAAMDSTSRDRFLERSSADEI